MSGEQRSSSPSLGSQHSATLPTATNEGPRLVCTCRLSPGAWVTCPLIEHDHTRCYEHGWNCPQACFHPDAVAARNAREASS